MISVNATFKGIALVATFAFVLTLSLAPMVYANNDNDNTSKVTSRDGGAKSELYDGKDDNDSNASSTEDKHDGRDDEDNASSTKDRHDRGDGEGHQGMSSIQDLGHNLDARSLPELENILKLLQQLLALILASKGA